MDSNDESKEIDIKIRTCYYFHDINKFEYFDLDNILIDGKSYKNILAYKISYKTLIGDKPLHIRIDKVHGFIGDYDRTKYLKLFGGEKYNFIYNRI